MKSEMFLNEYVYVNHYLLSHHNLQSTKQCKYKLQISPRFLKNIYFRNFFRIISRHYSIHASSCDFNSYKMLI